MTITIEYIVCFILIVIFLYGIWKSFVVYKNKSKINRESTGQSYLIIYASQSGQIEAHVQNTAQKLIGIGKSVTVIEANQLSATLLSQASHVIWMLSMYGEGETPDAACNLKHWFFEQSLDLSSQSFAILALGDGRYQHFCQFADRIYDQLIQYKAMPWFDVVKIDQHSLQGLSTWHQKLRQSIFTRLELNEPVKDWHLLTLKSQQKLNSHHSLYKIILKVPQTLTWNSGDILEIQCANVGSELSAFKKQYPDLVEDDLNDLVFKDLLNSPIRQNNQSKLEWLEQFKDLPLREYCIANLPGTGYLHLVIEQQLKNQTLGMGSGQLTQKMQVGQNLVGTVRHNPLFQLIDIDHPAIFIGFGSGIAGLMSHLYQREKNQQKPNWLILNQFKRADDSFNDQLNTWLHHKLLSDIDWGNVDENGDIKSLQKILFDKQDQLRTWMREGAIIYLCGDANRMAKAVDEMLTEVFGECAINEFKISKRYLRNVY